MRDASCGRIRKASVAALTWPGTEPGLSLLETQKQQLLLHGLGPASAGRGCSSSHPAWRCTVVETSSSTGSPMSFLLAGPQQITSLLSEDSSRTSLTTQETAVRSCSEAEQTPSSLPWPWLKTQHPLRAAFPRPVFAFLSSLDEQNETVTKSIIALTITSSVFEKRIITQSVLRVRT